MAFAKLPDSKRDSNSKSSFATWPAHWLGCAFVIYFALPILERLNCATSKQLSYDLLCAFRLVFNWVSGGILHVTCAVLSNNGWVLLAMVLLLVLLLLLLQHMPFDSGSWLLLCNKVTWLRWLFFDFEVSSLDFRALFTSSSSSSLCSSSDELFELSPLDLCGFIMRLNCSEFYFSPIFFTEQIKQFWNEWNK